MPQVVQIQRAPNSWDQAGQTVQQTADNFLKSMLAMGQMQNNNAWRMAEMNLQNQRIADANTRQDKQLAAVDARSKEELAQRLQMHNDTMALHRAQFGLHQQALSEKNYERDLLRKLLDGTNPSAQDNTGLNAAVNEVLSPNWSPTSGGGQQDFGSMYDNGVRAGLLKPLPSMSGFGGGVDTPSPIAPIPTQAEVQLPRAQLNAPSLNYDPTKNTPLSQRPMLEVAKLTGLFPQLSDSPAATQAETTPPAPQASMAAPAQAQLPADSGRLPMPSLPEKASIVLQGVPVTVDTFPTAFLAIPAGQRIFDSLKAKQEMLNHQYDLEMKAYKENTKQDQPLPFDQATKLSNLKEAYNQIQSLAGGLFDQGGNFNRMDSAKSQVPGTPEYQYKVKAMQAVEAWLRAMTGAAVQKEESEQYAQMYIPMPWDNGDVALDKLSRLENNYTGALKEMGRQGGVPPSMVADVRERRKSSSSKRPPLSSF